MDDTIQHKLQLLKLDTLLHQWDIIVKQATSQQPSYHRFLAGIIDTEYAHQQEKMRASRIRRALIPAVYVMDTFPFTKQPRLKKKLIMELYDSLHFIKQKQELIFIGPTGCGKTGLATSFLIHAIHNGYRGCFIDFNMLIERFRKSIGDHSNHKLLKHLHAYDILLIDEVSCVPAMTKEIAAMFFNLLKARNTHHTTIITSQLGFSEWEHVLQDKHLAMALLDRITQHCTVFNMSQCISIRPKHIVYASQK